MIKGVRVVNNAFKETLRQLDKAERFEARAATKVAVDFQRQMGKYPPKRPSSNYVRTGLLGKGWRFKLPPEQIVLYNWVLYTKWVQIAETQASIHKGRWPTDEQIIASSDEKWAKIFDAEIQKAFK